MVNMKTDAGGGQAAQSLGSGWPTPGPGSPALHKGVARQAGCAEVAVDDEHGGPSVAKPRCILGPSQPGCDAFVAASHHRLVAFRCCGNSAKVSNQAAAGVSCTRWPWL